MIADTRNQTDTLAVAEEALKDGAIVLVVMEITRPLNLREGRRLQLAAKAGNATGLCLIPEGMGSNAAETRWRCSPVFDPEDGGDSTLMRWEIIKNKKGTLGAWHVRWNAATHRLDVVSPVADGPGAATVPD
ncbi:ImuA family protein [Paracoccus litorisediminis]